MLGCCLVAVCSAAAPEVQSLNLNIRNGKSLIFNVDLKPGELTNAELNENHTMYVSLMTTFAKPPRNNVVVLECGPHSISFPMNYKAGKLWFEFTPQKLAKLYKHRGVYNLKLMVADKSLEKPLFLNVAKVHFVADDASEL